MIFNTIILLEELNITLVLQNMTKQTS